MNKRINELKISKENKILLSKMEKKIDILSEKVNKYFDSKLKIDSDSIKDAFSNNEDLLKILNKNNEDINEIKRKFYSIREKYQVDFKNKEDSEEEIINKKNIIQNTLDSRTKLFNSEKKMFVLNKKIKYMDKKTKNRKKEMNKELKELEKKINNNDLLDIASMEEDLYLIKNYINESKIRSKKAIYIIPVFLVTISLFIVVVISLKIF